MSAVPSVRKLFQHQEAEKRISKRRERTVRPEEQDFWLPVQIDNLLLDSRTMSGDKQVDNSLNTHTIGSIHLSQNPVLR